MAKTEKAIAQQNGDIPLAAVPHLYNIEMLKWQKVNFELLKEIHKQLVKLNRPKRSKKQVK